MTRVMPAQYRVDGNWIHFPGKRWNSVQIPFGLGVGRTVEGKVKRQPIRVKVKDDIIAGLDIFAQGEWRKVLPAFNVEVQIPSLACPLVIDTAVSDVDRSAAQALLKRIHYLGARRSGFILLARIRNSKARERTRKNFKGGSIGDTGDVVGALLLERFFRGNPKGRDAIYRDLGKRVPLNPLPGSKPGFRGRIVRDLGLYWISRVVVEPPFQQLGIGSILCDAARQVAKDRMLESGLFVELIRQMPLRRYYEVAAGESDFLTGNSKTFGRDLPFKLRTPFLSRVPTKAGGSKHERSVPSCKAYYFSKAGRMVLRSTPRHPPKSRQREDD